MAPISHIGTEAKPSPATRLCFVDYDSSMAIVAEVDVGGERKLAGVGRLDADADHHEAE